MNYQNNDSQNDTQMNEIYSSRKILYIRAIACVILGFLGLLIPENWMKTFTVFSGVIAAGYFEIHGLFKSLEYQRLANGSVGAKIPSTHGN